MALILGVLLLLLAAVTFTTTYMRADSAQLTAMQQAASQDTQGFSIPNDTRLADPEQIYPALVAAAKAAQVNVFRTSAGYTTDNQAQTTFYVLLNGPTRLWDGLPLDSGRQLIPKDNRASEHYLSTTTEPSTNQVGVLRDFGGNDLVYVRPLGAAFTALPVAGSYQVETDDPQIYHHFLQLLADEVTRADGLAKPLASSVFTGASSESHGVVTNNDVVLTAVQYLIVLLTTMLLVYRMLYEAKRAAVMKLHGYPTRRIWYTLTGRLVTSVLGGSIVVSAVASLLVHDAPASFAVSVVTSLILISVLMVAASLLTCLYISRIRISESVKNRKDTGGIFAVNTAVKAIAAMLIITVGAGLWTQYRTVANEREKLGDWQETRNFGVFYPTSVGNDLTEAQTGQLGPTSAEAYELYPVLNQMGSLFVDSSAYEPSALNTPAEPGTYRSIQVNPNYLSTYPIRDTSGRPVEVSDTTQDWVVLAPEAYKPQQAQLVAYFQRGRTGATGQQGAVQAEKAIFGRSAPARFVHQRVRIIWTADRQKVFSFNPEVDPTGGNLIDDPIVQVMTTGNSLGIDRANAITGSSDTALKVRLTNGDTTETQRLLAPTLHDLRLDDNLRHLVTMNEYVLLHLQHLQQGVRDVAIAAAALLVGMLVLVVQNLTIMFERYSRKIVVRRLFGLRFWGTYREFLRLFAVIAVVQVIGALVANQLGVTPFATDTSNGAANPLAVISIAGALVAAELGFSVVVLAALERRNVVKVLKGDF